MKRFSKKTRMVFSLHIFRQPLVTLWAATNLGLLQALLSLVKEVSAAWLYFSVAWCRHLYIARRTSRPRLKYWLVPADMYSIEGQGRWAALPGAGMAEDAADFGGTS